MAACNMLPYCMLPQVVCTRMQDFTSGALMLPASGLQVPTADQAGPATSAFAARPFAAERPAAASSPAAAGASSSAASKQAGPALYTALERCTEQVSPIDDSGDDHSGLQPTLIDSSARAKGGDGIGGVGSFGASTARQLYAIEEDVRPGDPRQYYRSSDNVSPASKGDEVVRRAYGQALSGEKCGRHFSPEQSCACAWL